MANCYQDWAPVNIGNGKKPTNNTKTSNYTIPKGPQEDPETGMMNKKPSYPQILIDQLREARVAKGLTQAKLAQQLNYDVSIINKLENNQYPYNKRTYLNIMKRLGVDTTTIKFPDDDKK